VRPLPPSDPDNRPSVTPTQRRLIEQLPAQILFFDVETTGLHSKDRVVSLGTVLLQTRGLLFHRLHAECNHWIFDPGKKSHPAAQQVHGYDDWVLRHQDQFSVHAEKILQLFQNVDLLVAHNYRFDSRFIAQEFELCGLEHLPREAFCTMEAWRAERGPPAGLDAVCKTINLFRTGRRHGALEDAFLAMAVYLSMKIGFAAPSEGPAGLGPPSNFRQPPPMPPGPLPRRKRVARGGESVSAQ
jgi:DNA polymerase-3 subunit epsilon